MSGSSSIEERAELELLYYQDLSKTEALYARGTAAGPEDKSLLAEFSDTFLKLAEPPLLPRYYRLDPDFWEWLRREGGRSIPPSVDSR